MPSRRVIFPQSTSSVSSVGDVFAQTIMIPVQIISFGLNRLFESARQFSEASEPPRPVNEPTLPPAPPSIQLPVSIPTLSTVEEQKRMPDMDLSDDQLKLVRYKILFVKRNYECAFGEVEEILHDHLTESDFKGWKLAEFAEGVPSLQSSHLPSKWRKYLCENGGCLRHEDRKYLRVYYEVLDRFPREELRYEEQTLDRLQGIEYQLQRIGSKLAPDA